MTICDDLRQSVLQAAIQGKLTKQLPEDGTAGDLLASIKAEKEQLVKEKKIKKEKPLAPISEDEIPFDIPDNWEWVRWGDISNSVQYGYNSPAMDYGNAKMVRISDIQNNRIIWDNVPYCKIDDNEIDTYILHDTDILFARTGGTVGKSCLVEGMPEDIPYIYAGYLIRSNYNSRLDPKYLKYFMDSELYWYQLRDGTTKNAQPNCNGKTLSKMIIPLPPLAEQHRIVARVDELMAKIDELETVEKELVALKKAFPGDMKASLLQAAMQGKLTQQLPEESVAEIENYLHIDSKLCPIKDVPFDIPENWKWIQIGNLGESADTDSFADGPFGSNLKREHQISEHEVRIIQLSNIGENGWKNENEKYTSYDHLEKVIPRCEVTPGCFVIAKMMPAGRTILVPELGTRITLGSDAMKFKPNSILNKKYLLYAMRSQAFLGQVYAEVHGITRVRTTLNGVKGYVLPIPPLAEQQRIVEKLDKLLPLCDALKEDGVA